MARLRSAVSTIKESVARRDARLRTTKEVELDVRRLEFSMDQVDGFLSALEARTRA